MPLVVYLARRFSGRNEPMNDLVQVGSIGLLKAIDRFEPGRGLEFSTYATPTILGEIKRHFRDTGWLIHVPRRAQELQTTVNTARAGPEPGTGPRAHRHRTRRAHRGRRGRRARGPRRCPGVLRRAARRACRARRDRCPSTRCSASSTTGFEQVEQRALLRDVIAEAARDRTRDPAAALRREQDPDRDRRDRGGVPDAGLATGRPQGSSGCGRASAPRSPGPERRQRGSRSSAARAGGVNSRYSTTTAAPGSAPPYPTSPAWNARL